MSAPGGWFRDGFGTDTYRTDQNEILSTYPLNVLQSLGEVDADGNVVAGFENSVFKSCTATGACGYYAYLQGTSMAAPHATGGRRADRQPVGQRLGSPVRPRAGQGGRRC